MRSSGALESWAAQLGFLADEVAIGVEQMARRMDLAMEDAPALVSGMGEPNGYGGIDRRGSLDRLLLTDWVLADAAPDEFNRRLAFGELSFLRIEHTEPKPPSQVVVLVDAGPLQIGPPRLTQLAGLVVLYRRAHALGIPLALGILGDEPGTFSRADLPDLFAVWLRARRTFIPMEDDVDDWLSAIEGDSRCWLFGCPALAGTSFSRDLRHLHASESSWGPDGAETLTVQVDRRLIELPLPEPSASLRLLRGNGLRRRTRSSTLTSDGMRFPRFPSSVRRLLCRGETDDILVVIRIPKESTSGTARPKRRRFPGPVLAASMIGSRTVALVAMGGGLRVVVIGKGLGKVEQIDVSLIDVELDQGAIETLCANSLEPLFFFSGRIVVRLGEQWWSLSPSGSVQRVEYLDGVATAVVDQPRFLRRSAGSVDVGDKSYDVPTQARILLGANGHIAHEVGENTWLLRGYRDCVVEVSPGATVLGLTKTERQLQLLVQSSGGHIVRLIGPDSQKTLTKFSKDIIKVEVHPTQPIAAFQRSDSTIEVVDLETLTRLTIIRMKRS